MLQPVKFHTLILSCLLLFSSFALAEFEFSTQEKDDVSVTVGTFLPWGGIPGVRDQYRMWGFSYFHPSSIWDLEYQFLNARGQGVVYYVASAGVRINFIIEKVLEVFLTGGLDYHFYKRAPYQGRSYDYNQTMGIHLGFGGFFPISEVVKLRGDLKFHNGPGKSIYIGIGPTVLF